MAENAAEENHQNQNVDPLTQAASRMKGVLDDPYASKREEPPQEEPDGEVQASEEIPEESGTEEIEAEASESSDEEAVREEGAEPEPESYELGADQFAELLGIEETSLAVDDDGHVRFRAKGEKDFEDVTLDQLINAYQGNANLTNRSKEMAEMKKQHEKALSDFNQQITQHAQQAAVRLEAINNAYESDLANIDWKELQEDDPGQYAAKKLEMSERKAKIDQMARDAISDLEKAQEDAQKQQAQFVQEKMQREGESMQQAFKEMNVKMDDEMDKSLTEYVTKRFKPEVIQQMGPVMPMDEFTVLAYKAMMYDKGRTKAEVLKTKKIPKVLKPGNKPSAKVVKAQEQNEARAKHKKDGSVDSAVDAMKKMGIL